MLGRTRGSIWRETGKEKREGDFLLKHVDDRVNVLMLAVVREITMTQRKPAWGSGFVSNNNAAAGDDGDEDDVDDDKGGLVGQVRSAVSLVMASWQPPPPQAGFMSGRERA